MPEFAPGFDGANQNVLPKNTQPLTNSLVRNGLVSTTVGAAAGTSTVVNKSKIEGRNSTQADKQVVAAEALINRNSTAADVTALKSKFTKKRPAFAMPRDLSGNGGPAFTRT